MDPNVLLSKIRELTGKRNIPEWDGYAEWYDLAEQVVALDDWLTKGGFPPEAWAGKRERVVYVVQRENFDGLYGFEDEAQAEEYAALFRWQNAAPVDNGELHVLDMAAAGRLIEETKLEMAED